jgi:hypothetical protein
LNKKKDVSQIWPPRKGYMHEPSKKQRVIQHSGPRGAPNSSDRAGSRKPGGYYGAASSPRRELLGIMNPIILFPKPRVEPLTIFV